MTVLKSATLALALLCGMTSLAAADSCWWHNGSLMRLKAQGNQRWFVYEDPRPVLRAGGVQRGTLLFSGVKRGHWYEGLSRVFSKYCPGNPLEYWVEGPVSANPLRVTLRGTREVQNRCQPTDRIASDELVFTYSHRC